MGKVINPAPPGKERNELLKSVAISLRELMAQSGQDHRTRDLAAFIALALAAITETVEKTVTPWEKRGYWVKSDRFRWQWEWTGRLGAAMEKAVHEEDWTTVAGLSAQVAEKLQDVKLPRRKTVSEPWQGAWEKLRGKQQDEPS